MSADLTEAACVTPPTEANVFARASVAASERLEIPASWRNHYVTFQAEGVDVHVTFGDSAVAADRTATASVASEVMTVDDTSTVLIPAGTERAFDLGKLGKAVTHFAHISPSTGGYLRMYRSGGSA